MTVNTADPNPDSNENVFLPSKSTLQGYEHERQEIETVNITNNRDCS